MPGQLNLTGANAAIQLVGNDTITEDQEFVFPDTGGTVVTDDFTGNVEINGGLTQTTSDGITYLNNSSVTALAVNDTADERKISLNWDGTAAFSGRVEFNSTVNPDIEAQYGGIFYSNNGPNTDYAAVFARNLNAAGRNYVGANSSGSVTWEVFSDGTSTFSNAILRLDPDDPSKVLDVKESIRTMQAALFQLKAAVLVPHATVDDLRLRILEALETITEEAQS